MSLVSLSKKIFKLLFELDEDRKKYSKEYIGDLHRQARLLHLPGSIMGIFVWLGFAFDTDRKLHPEFPELFYFRIGLSLICLFLLILFCLDKYLKIRTRGKGLGWGYFLFLYLLNATAFFTGRIADDPTYVSGFQIAVMTLVFMPFPRRAIVLFYIGSIFSFLIAVLIYHPNLSTNSASYSMQNLTISYLVGFFSGFIMERFRFTTFLSRHKILEKNKEISLSMTQIQNLKTKQDGDYFLTTLLFNPLIGKEVESGFVKIEYTIRQHKKFMFREKEYELGGDYISVYNLILQGKKYKAFVNGDAMGKSVQGAGGAIVLGAVYNSIIIRSKMDPNSSNRSPERWLTDCFMDLQKVFETFDGGMLVSAIFGLLEETSGTLYYINLEHPWMVLFRDGKADFVDHEHHFYKLGVTGITSSVAISVLKLKQGDKVFCGSDGKDDLIMEESSSGKRVINEDETQFLQRLEEVNGNLYEMESKLRSYGNFSDDFSLISLEYTGESHSRPNKNYYEAKDAMLAHDFEKALEILSDGFDPVAASSKELKLLARLYEKKENIFQALEYAGMALEIDPSDTAWLLHTSLLFKRVFAQTKSMTYLGEAQELSERVRLRDPRNVKNMIHLADIYRLQGNKERANYLLGKIDEGERNHPILKKLVSKII
ncbi:SpoIIE family protein phosphatase [Leptospira sp. 'Mane']|uniref:SpoIIE family protein phosphatase n=1 Tax=Leptospira sp. 'Mane' TaxID=3387407 RepID=UPI00398A6C49